MNDVQDPSRIQSDPVPSRRRKRVRRGLVVACAIALSGAVIGCKSNDQSAPSAPQQAPRVAPRDAERVGQGARELSYKAPVDGTIYAEDQDTGTTLFAKRLRAGQHLEFRADNGTVLLDGRPQTIPDIDQHRGHTFKLFFAKSEAAGSK